MLEFKLSKITISIGLFIIISASFMNQVLGFIQRNLGRDKTTFFLGIAVIVTCLIFLIFVFLKKAKPIKALVIILWLALGLMVAWQTNMPAEKVHVIEYGILGWFALRDLLRVNQKVKAAILACVFASIMGVFDELFQWVLPYRTFEIQDIVFNVLGGIWGVGLYLLEKTNFPRKNL